MSDPELNTDGLPLARHPPFDAQVQFRSPGLKTGQAAGNHASVDPQSGPGFFAHETAHALFELADERGCEERDQIRFEAPRHPNIFATSERCDSLSMGPKLLPPRACFEIPNSRDTTQFICSDVQGDGWWKSEPPDDIMQSQELRTFGPDCQKNIQKLFEGLR